MFPHKLFLVVFLLAASASNVAKAECCQWTGFVSCCGFGPCNIFCCKCKDGCRCRRRLEEGIVDPVTPAASVSAARFRTIDKNGDGEISLEESLEWANRRRPNNTTRRLTTGISRGFKAADTNGDGRIQPSEFDDDLA